MKLWLKLAVTVALVAVAVGGGAIAIKETAPEVAFDLGLVRPFSPYDTRLNADGTAPSFAASTAASASVAGRRTPSGDRLVIPRIALDDPVVQGSSISALKRGLWLEPPSAMPGEPGAAVIAGHRISSEFTLLPKLRPGDGIALFWKGAEYDYRVESVGVMDASRPDAGPGKPGEPASLVLYTCTPRWKGDKRVVVYCSPVR